MVDIALAHLRGADVVAVLTRAPSAGGKTRLFADLVRPFDATLLEAFLFDTLDSVRASTGRGVLCIEPASEIARLQSLVPDMPVIPQSSGNLGERMRACMSSIFEMGARRVALVGSDLPTLSARVIDSAFGTLDRDPEGLVLGPADDGGYFLIAAASVPPVFDRIAWSTPSVRAQTIAAAGAAGWRTHLVDSVEDIDTADALRRAATTGGARTRAWILAHLE